MKRLALYLVVLVGLSCIPAYALIGDVDNDTFVDLKDVVLSLRVCAGLSPSGVFLSGDVNGDKKIGLEEVLYGLRVAAGLGAGSGQNGLGTGNQQFTVQDAQSSDPLNSFRVDSERSNIIPVSIDYSSSMPDVKNQGQTGSCTSWASGYYYKTYQEFKEEGWDKNQNAFSPMYLYAMQCRTYNSPWSIMRALEIMRDYGCAKWNTVPYTDYEDDTQKYAALSISQSVQDEARQYRSGEISSQLKNLSQIKEALTAGPVVLSINRYQRGINILNWSPSPENNYLTYDAAHTDAGHAVLCVGYDDSKFGVGAIKFINSWGPTWATDGHSWIRYSDVANIVNYGMTIKDLPNPHGSGTTQTKPSAPTDVQATQNAGPYVDITWSKVSNAKYYRIFRAKVGDAATYAEVGTANSSPHRDTPAPNIRFYYSVVAVNDIGESDHRSIDTDSKSYVKIGIAKGNTLKKPKVSWISNDDNEVKSSFKVGDIDTSANKMEIFVALSSEGPWSSFGWVKPEDFSITWGKNSEYIGKQPFIKVTVSNADGISESSSPVQIAKQIIAPVPIAKFISFSGAATSDYIRLSWSTDGGNADFFEIWRYKAASDVGNDWILIGYAGSSERSYYDYAASPGVSYYYGIFAVYKGTYSPANVTNQALTRSVLKPNLYLYEVTYNYGEITNPAFFKLKVWNTGGVAVSDYTISIKVYDWNDGLTYLPFDEFKASDFAASGQLPLNPSYEHELSVSLTIPSSYGDGHYYSWVIEVNPTRGVDELYYDDNTISSNDGWWSYDLSPKPNLSLDGITYNYGQLRNPVLFDLDVSNTGGTTISDYTISISAYDWNDGKEYSPFYDFKASSVASYGQLPLKGGYSQTLSFNKTIPSVYADGHYYYWRVMIDPDNTLTESKETDNYMESDSAWQLLLYARDNNSSEPKILSPQPAAEERFNADKLRDAPVVNEIQASAAIKNSLKVRKDSQSVSSQIGSSRPFSKKRVITEKVTRDQEGPYVGPIRFKQPPFCINHAE